jgi:hypothetical protein
MTWMNVILVFEDHFPKPEESSAARPSSSSPPSGSDHGWVDVEKPQPSIPEEPSPVSSPDHAPPSPGPSTESDHELTGVHAPLSSPVVPTWFLTDHGYHGPHAPQANSDDRLVVGEPPSRPASPTEFDADHEYQMVHPSPPSPGSASLIESDHEMVDVPPSSSVSSTNPGRRSMGIQGERDRARSPRLVGMGAITSGCICTRLEQGTTVRQNFDLRSPGTWIRKPSLRF